jgi:polysaccharide biosynthesis transport protein
VRDQYPIQQTFATPTSELKPTWPSGPAQEDVFELWEYWSSIRGHARLILSFFLVAELLTLLMVQMQTPLYTGSSTILIESQTPQVLEPKTERDAEDAPSFYKTQSEILQSKSLAAGVIRALELDKDPLFTGAVTKPTLLRRLLSSARSLFSRRLPQNADDDSDILGVKVDFIDRYLAGLTIRPDLDTRLVIIAFTSPYPALIPKIVNAHVQAYIQQDYELRSRSSDAAGRFLKGQLDKLENSLEKSEVTLNGYRRQRGIVAFSLDDKDRLVSERMTALNKGLVDAEERRIALQAEVETINNKDYDAVPEVVDNSLIQNLKVQLSRLQGQYANLSNQFTPDYPDVAQLHAQLLQVQRHEQQEIARVVESIKSRYKAALDRETELAKQLQDEKVRAMSLNDASLEDAVLTRDVATNRALYTSVLERMKVLGVTSAAQVTNVSIIDAASVPTYPSSPKKKLDLVLAGFLALMLGVGPAFVIESADEGLKNADEVQQYLRLPNLATVSCFSSSKDRRVGVKQLLRLPKRTDDSESKYTNALTRRDNGHDTMECPAATNPSANGGVPAPPSYGAAGEAYRAIRTSILLSCSEKPPKIILFTSTKAGEGKTVTAINTAIAFASMFDRVLLIDGDLRRSRCHEIMNVEAGPGLTEVLSGLNELKDAIQSTRVKGLFLLSGGLSAPNPSELLGFEKAASGSGCCWIFLRSRSD